MARGRESDDGERTDAERADGTTALGDAAVIAGLIVGVAGVLALVVSVVLFRRAAVRRRPVARVCGLFAVRGGAGRRVGRTLKARGLLGWVLSKHNIRARTTSRDRAYGFAA
jgi:hypothetical protein